MSQSITELLNDFERKTRVDGMMEELTARSIISSLRFALGEVEKQRREAELLLERIAETKSVIASLLGADA